jgi:release factor glutamine methyltransferase
MRLVTLPGVFTPISDSWMLAEAAAEEVARRGGRSLDLCTGSGVVAVASARAGARATAVDVSRRAVLTARLNARLNGTRVDARRGDLFGAVDGDRYALITSNPPYVPAASDDLPGRGPQRAWEAGRDGRVLLDRICDEAPRHLAPGGCILLVHSDLIGERETLERLAAGGLDVDVVRRERGPLGPLMRDIQRDGLIPADVQEEDVVVIRGRAV